MSGLGLHGDDAVDAIRALRAVLHGFVTLEAQGGFGLPADVDRSFDRLCRRDDATVADRSAFGSGLVRVPGQAAADRSQTWPGVMSPVS